MSEKKYEVIEIKTSYGYVRKLIDTDGSIYYSKRDVLKCLYRGGHLIPSESIESPLAFGGVEYNSKDELRQILALKSNWEMVPTLSQELDMKSLSIRSGHDLKVLRDISKALKFMNFQFQFHVGKYVLDAYSDYGVILHHIGRKKYARSWDMEKPDEIVKSLKNPKWIYFSIHEGSKFDIFELINEIIEAVRDKKMGSLNI